MTHQQLTLSDYHIGDSLYSSRTSTIYKGRQKKSLKYVAIKKFPQSRRQRATNEVSILRELPTHPNIVQFFSFHETPNHLWIVNEYCAGGDLTSVFSSDTVSESVLLGFLHYLLSSLTHLHLNNITYTNLYGVLKLGDFGFAHRSDHPFTSPPPSIFVDPEVLKGTIPLLSSDFWSLGVLLASSVIKLDDCSLTSIDYRKVVSQLKNTNLSAHLIDFLLLLIQPNVRKRATWNTISTHTLFNDLKSNFCFTFSSELIEQSEDPGSLSEAPNDSVENDDQSMSVKFPNSNADYFISLLNSVPDTIATPLFNLNSIGSNQSVQDHPFTETDESSINHWIGSLMTSLDHNDVKIRSEVCNSLISNLKSCDFIATNVANSNLFLKLVNILLSSNNVHLSFRILETLTLILRKATSLVSSIIDPSNRSYLIDFLSTSSISKCNHNQSHVFDSDSHNHRRLAVTVTGELVFFW
ncbi:hypothetical protein GEMRC1_013067 [Eukaryota sp. GEM-RC1]